MAEVLSEEKMDKYHIEAKKLRTELKEQLLAGEEYEVKDIPRPSPTLYEKFKTIVKTITENE